MPDTDVLPETAGPVEADGPPESGILVDVTGFGVAVRRALDAVAGGSASEVWRALGAAGVTAALYPQAGPAARQPDPRRLALLLTELDRRFPLGVVLSVCVQVATVVPLLAEAAVGAPADPEAGRPGPAVTALRALLRGETIVALAVTDSAGSGSNLLDATTEARLDPDPGTATGTVTVNGGKNWITNAEHCEHALVLARHRAARHFTSFCWLLVPMSAPGVAVRPVGRDQFAGSGLGQLRFDAVVLDSRQVVGRPGRAMAGFARQIGVERLAGALWARALCRRLLVDLHRWLRERPAGAGTLWENAAVRERFARCLVRLAQLDAVCAPALDRPVTAIPAATGMLMKAVVGETVEQILAECVHLRGADAFRDGGEAALRSAAAMFGIAGGATGAMLAGIADHADELLREAP